MDRTCEVKKDVDKIFANALKSKLSKNQKKAKKRVQKLEEKATKEASEVVAAEAEQIKDYKRNRAMPPPLAPFVEEFSESNTELMRPRFESGVLTPSNFEPEKQRRAILCKPVQLPSVVINAILWQNSSTWTTLYVKYNTTILTISIAKFKSVTAVLLQAPGIFRAFNYLGDHRIGFGLCYANASLMLKVWSFTEMRCGSAP